MASTPAAVAGREPAPALPRDAPSPALDDAACELAGTAAPHAGQLQWELGFLATGLGHF